MANKANDSTFRSRIVYAARVVGASIFFLRIVFSRQASARVEEVSRGVDEAIEEVEKPGRPGRRPLEFQLQRRPTERNRLACPGCSKPVVRSE